MTIAINRRLLRQSWYGIPTPVEEQPRVPTANALKMRLARFGAAAGTGQAPPTGSVTTVTGQVTSVPSSAVNP